MQSASNPRNRKSSSIYDEYDRNCVLSMAWLVSIFLTGGIGLIVAFIFGLKGLRTMKENKKKGKVWR